LCIAFLFCIEFGKNTPPFTQAEMVIGAQFPLAKVGCITCSVLKDCACMLQYFFECLRATFGTDIASTVTPPVSGYQYLGKVFFGYFDKYITIVSLEEGIVRRFVLLDQVIFQIECL